MKAQLHMMTYAGMNGDIVGVSPDGKGVDITKQRFLMTSRCEWVFMKNFVSEHNMYKTLLDNQATLHVFKNEALVSNIRASRKVSIDGIDGRRTGM